MRRMLLLLGLVAVVVVLAIGLVRPVTCAGDQSAGRANESSAPHQVSRHVNDETLVAAGARTPVRPRPALPDRHIVIASPDTGHARTDEARAWFRDSFERFRRETGMSDERAQAILAVLYDYQENRRLDDELSRQSFRTRPPWEHEAWFDDTLPWGRDISMEAQTRLRALLSSSEHDAWVEIMGSRAWVTLRFHAPLG